MSNELLSEALKEVYASAPTDIVHLETLEIRHPAFTQPIRVVKDYVNLSAKLEATAPLEAGEVVEFIAFAFDLTLPEVQDSGVPELEIKMDNIAVEILQNIELAMPQIDKLEVTYRIYLDVDAVSHGPHNNPPLHLTVTSVSADSRVITAKASIADFVHKRFPSKDYDDVTFPGLITD